MNSNAEKFLLTEYNSPLDNHQLILSKFSKDTGPVSHYFDQIINKFSNHTVKKILEIYPSGSNPLEIELRKKGYDVTSIPFSLKVSAVGGNKDGEHYIIGDTFDFPVLNEEFDVIIVTQGIFGQIIQQNDIKSFLSHLNETLVSNGLLITEIWHFNGINRASVSEKGQKDWEIIESQKDLSILRLTNSKLNMFSSILEVEIKYIIENEKKKTFEKYNETHLYKLYNISELNSLFNENNFHCRSVLKMNSMEEPNLKTFRLISVAQVL